MKRNSKKKLVQAPARLKEIQKLIKQPTTDAAAFEKTILNIPPADAENRLREVEATLAHCTK